MGEAGDKPFKLQIESLTPRERQILELMAQNLSNREIAGRLFISPVSVKWYTHQIYNKLGFKDRRLSLSKVQELGLLGQPDPQTGPQAHNFPAPLTSFIGRQYAVAQVRQMLVKNPTSRVVTLSGAGGVGKTRLALRVAEDVLGSYPQGVWWVDLAALNDPGLAAQTIATVFGLQMVQNRPVETLLLDFLRGKKLLLVLDNCEHLVETIATLACRLLEKNSGLTILATSREVLGVDGEKVFRVPSLALPGIEEPASLPQLMQYEAIQLFVERAQAASVGFELVDANARAVMEICRRLDAIPLAIELAAARIRMISPGQIAQRLNAVFQLLNSGNRIELPRHKTLRASIDWSYNLLSPQERNLFNQLSVFSGSWTVEAVEGTWSVASPSRDNSGSNGEGEEGANRLDLLNQLVDKSLVQAIPCDAGTCRFRMLETIRQYAQEKLGQTDQMAAARDRHLTYYLSLAERYEALLRTESIYELLGQLDLELENLRGAIAWAIGKNDPEGAEKALYIIDDLFYFWHLRSMVCEVDGWIKRAISLLPNSDPQANDLKAWSLLILALLKVQYNGMASECLECLDTSIALYRQAKDSSDNQMKLALALAQRKFTFYRGLDILPHSFKYRYQGALRDGEESLSIAQNLPKPASPEASWFQAWIYSTNAYTEGYYDSVFTPGLQVVGRVQQLLMTAYELSIRLGDQVNELMILLILAAISRYDDGEKCKAYAQRGIALAKRLGDKKRLADILCMSGVALYRSGQFQEMEENFHEVYLIGCQIGDIFHEIYGARMQGFAAVLQADALKARPFLEKALALSSSHQDTPGVLAALIGISGLAVLLEKNRDAARMLGFINRQYEDVYRPISRLDRMEFDRYAASLKARLGADDFAALWAEGRLMAMEHGIKQALALTEPQER